jgi:hypothetical protein
MFLIGDEHPKNISLLMDSGSAWVWAYSDNATDRPWSGENFKKIAGLNQKPV